MQKFKSGDVVVLNSGSPKMTVVGYIDPLDITAAIYRTKPKDMGESVMVKVTWFEGSKPKGNSYHQDLLSMA